MLYDIPVPEKPKDGNIIFGVPIPPLVRLRTFSSSEFEEMVMEWAYDYLKGKYSQIKGLGGSGDKGRDVIGYYDNSEIDIYQCKQYDSPLAPSNYWVEFGKLCYYTYNGDYKIPINYYIVASSGIGQTLSDLIDNPQSINSGIIKNWDNYCKTKITKTSEVSLTGDFKTYVEEFDFSIVKQIAPIRLIDEYSNTKWYKYRFGGGLKKRPKPDKPPVNIDEDEKKLLYITELIKAYEECTAGKVVNLDSLREEKRLFDHFSRQREAFYSAQSLKRFSRDELIDEEPYEEAKKQIFDSVIDVVLDSYESSLKRINETLSEARKIPVDIEDLGNVQPNDKCGMCHELVNEEKIKWVAVDGEY